MTKPKQEAQRTALEGYDFSGSKYGNEDRRNAVVNYQVHGSYKKTAEVTGIPASTIRGWAKSDWWLDVSTTVRAETDDKVRAKMLQIVDSAQDRVLEALPEASAAQAATVMGISFDKVRILDNQPTVITQGSSGGIQAQLEELSTQLTEQDRKAEAKVVREQKKDEE